MGRLREDVAATSPRLKANRKAARRAKRVQPRSPDLPGMNTPHTKAAVQQNTRQRPEHVPGQHRTPQYMGHLGTGAERTMRQPPPPVARALSRARVVNGRLQLTSKADLHALNQYQRDIEAAANRTRLMIHNQNVAARHIGWETGANGEVGVQGTGDLTNAILLATPGGIPKMLGGEGVKFLGARLGEGLAKRVGGAFARDAGRLTRFPAGIRAVRNTRLNLAMEAKLAREAPAVVPRAPTGIRALRGLRLGGRAAAGTVGAAARYSPAASVVPELAPGGNLKKGLTGQGRLASILPHGSPQAGVVHTAANAIVDMVNLPANTLPMIYIPAAAVFHWRTTGDDRPLRMVWESLKATSGISHALSGDWRGVLKLAQQHPVYLAAELGGAYALAGRGAGAGIRGVSPEAAPRTLGARQGVKFESGALYPRRPSPNVITALGQFFRDRVVAPERQGRFLHGKPAHVRLEQRRLDQIFADEETVVRHRENALNKAAKSGDLRNKKGADVTPVVPEAIEGTFDLNHVAESIPPRITQLQREAVGLPVDEAARNQALINGLHEVLLNPEKWVPRLIKARDAYVATMGPLEGETIGLGRLNRTQAEIAKGKPGLVVRGRAIQVSRREMRERHKLAVSEARADVAAAQKNLDNAKLAHAKATAVVRPEKEVARLKANRGRKPPRGWAEYERIDKSGRKIKVATLTPRQGDRLIRVLDTPRETRAFVKEQRDALKAAKAVHKEAVQAKRRGVSRLEPATLREQPAAKISTRLGSNPGADVARRVLGANPAVEAINAQERGRPVIEDGTGTAEDIGIKPVPDLVNLPQPTGERMDLASMRAHQAELGIDPADLGYVGHYEPVGSALEGAGARIQSNAPVTYTRTSTGTLRGTNPADLRDVWATPRRRIRSNQRFITIRTVIEDLARPETFPTGRAANDTLTAQEKKVYVPINTAPYERRAVIQDALGDENPAAMSFEALDYLESDGAKVLDEATGNIDQPGDWRLIRASHVDRLRQHIDPKLSIGPLEKVTAAWKRVVLVTTPTWYGGNFSQTLFGETLNGLAPPFVAAAAERLGIGAAGRGARLRLVADERLAAGIVPGGVAETTLTTRNARMRANAREDPNVSAWLDSVHAVTMRKSGDPRAAVDLWNHFSDGALLLNGKLIEEPFFVQMWGKVAAQEIRAQLPVWDRFHAVTGAALEEFMAGTHSGPAALALADIINKQTGNWHIMSPTEKAIKSNFMPFYMWHRMAVRFVFLTVPHDHPVFTGLVAASASATEEERKRLGLDLSGPNKVPSYLQGGLPVAGGGIRQTQNLSAFGMFADYPGNFAQSLLPVWQGPIMLALGKGIKWNGQAFVTSQGRPIDQATRVKYAIWLMAEPFIPFAGVVNKYVKAGRQEVVPGVYRGAATQRGAGRLGQAIIPTPLPGSRIFHPEKFGAGAGGSAAASDSQPSPGGGGGQVSPGGSGGQVTP